MIYFHKANNMCFLMVLILMIFNKANLEFAICLPPYLLWRFILNKSKNYLYMLTLMLDFMLLSFS